AQHAGNAGAGVGPGAGEVEVRDIFAAVVRPKPRRLRENRLDGERAAEMAVERIAEVTGVHRSLRHDVPGQVRQVAALEVANDGVPVRARRRLPVDGATEMWDWRQGVPRIAARRRQRAVGGGRTMQVKREVSREAAPTKDVV